MKPFNDCCPIILCTWQTICETVFPGRSFKLLTCFQLPIPYFIIAQRSTSASAFVHPKLLEYAKINKPGATVKFHKDLLSELNIFEIRSIHHSK